MSKGEELEMSKTGFTVKEAARILNVEEKKLVRHFKKASKGRAVIEEKELVELASVPEILASSIKNSRNRAYSKNLSWRPGDVSQYKTFAKIACDEASSRALADKLLCLMLENRQSEQDEDSFFYEYIDEESAATFAFCGKSSFIQMMIKELALFENELCLLQKSDMRSNENGEEGE